MPDELPAEPGSAAEDRALIAALRAGDATAFMQLVERNQAAMIRVAQQYVSSRETAEEVVQEAWIGLLKALDRFEGRSSLRTFLFRIVMNIARTRGVREARSVPFSSLGPEDEDGPAMDPDRFVQLPDPLAGHWASPVRSWNLSPEQLLLSAEAVELVHGAIAELPDTQRRVITLRDVEGFDSGEVCELLEISEGNQRVLLHRARTKVRMALDGALA